MLHMSLAKMFLLEELNMLNRVDWNGLYTHRCKLSSIFGRALACSLPPNCNCGKYTSSLPPPHTPSGSVIASTRLSYVVTCTLVTQYCSVLLVSCVPALCKCTVLGLCVHIGVGDEQYNGGSMHGPQLASSMF